MTRKCMRFAICDTCHEIQRSKEQTCNPEKLKDLTRAEKVHLSMVRAERESYAARVLEARRNPRDVLSIAADGADQGTYGLPYYCQPSKTSSTLYKIRQYVFGVIVHGKNPHLYRHTDVRECVFA